MRACPVDVQAIRGHFEFPELGRIPGITIYGPRDASRRTSLVAFNLAGRDPSFYLYNTPGDVDQAVAAVAAIVADGGGRASPVGAHVGDAPPAAA